MMILTKLKTFDAEYHATDAESERKEEEVNADPKMRHKK